MKINYTNSTNTIDVSRIESLYLIPVVLGDIHIPFVFDTGATMTLMNKTTAANFKAIPCTAKVEGGGNAGSSFTANTAIIPVIQIGEVTIEDLHVVVVDDKQLDFGEDKTGNPLIINGFLGWDIIQHFKWQYDNKKKYFLMSTSIKEEVTPNMEEWDNMPIIRVLLNGEEELFGFDTGNTESILGPNIFTRIPDSSDDTDNFVGIDGTENETVRIAKDFTIRVFKQNIVLKKVMAINRQVFPTENENINGLLGADILEEKSWTLDYCNRILVID